ncbi:MAG: adenylate kinase [Myxococcales bacterium]|nr:adenylate kinase [Myxococcales bacterium]|tara:strand:- start:543 stop:1187 length:645 start_codon:yes stop_codon:yes gene_type:complete
MRLVLFGPPGAGKGTQAKKIEAELGALQISTGDLLRQAQADGTALGLKAAEYMNAGNLVPDEVVVGLIEDRTSQDDCKSGFILDGFPRTLPQLESLDQMLKGKGEGLDRVVSIEVPNSLLMERLCGRYSCKACGAVMHERDFEEGAPKVCLTCQTDALYQRADDKPEAIEQRLRTFDDQTAPVKAKYEQMGLLSRIDGVGSPTAVFDRIKEVLN